MELICYSTSDSKLKIAPAAGTREWMDQAGSFAYRCLPLNIANSHGWVLLNDGAFAAEWDGGVGLDAVRVTSLSDRPTHAASSHFGNGIVTFSIEGVFRTEPGYDLWVCGPTNMFKDAIQPLTALVETDWSPFTFTMNWKFTRANTPIFFSDNEPYCHFFPIRRGVLETVDPTFKSLTEEPALREGFEAWQKSRKNFNKGLAIAGSPAQAQKWQKDYFLGRKPLSQEVPGDHRLKLRLKEFR